jgi:hypothetical protein
MTDFMQHLDNVDDAIHYLMVTLLSVLPKPDGPPAELPFMSYFDSTAELYDHMMAESPLVSTPRVRTETKFIKWYKMIALYLVWGWVSYACPQAGFWTMVVNDGGQFANECYYMFYNGVVWYNPPKIWVVAPGLFG